ncbi:hypothetical protein [Acetoanaerobium sticklandii]|uniref:hypothetical protein n=1 Tax=Acetoanaerobium sticklandii TaxID=1511 RepID=UPI003A93992C
MKQIKIFNSITDGFIESYINKWLEEASNIYIEDIQFKPLIVETTVIYTCMIVYNIGEPSCEGER